MAAAKRIAVIGAGPAGAVTVDALAQEKAFTVIRVFERREAAGGCWIGDTKPPPRLTELAALIAKTADQPVDIPKVLPAQAPKLSRPRYEESSVYPYMETNVDALAMSFTQENIPVERSAFSLAAHGKDSPFRPWKVMRKYVQDMFDRRGYQDLVSYDTTVELAEKIGSEWKLTLRRNGEKTDHWWVEWFDAVVVASGHYSVPNIPNINGLVEAEKSRPGSVLHSKLYRGRDAFRGKRVVVVGASVSGADIATDLIGAAKSPVHAVVQGHRFNIYFGDEAFKHPGIKQHPSIERVTLEGGKCTVHLINGHYIKDVDHIVFATGYTWTLPFLKNVQPKNGRIPGLYLHVVHQHDPTLLFVGAVNAGLTFKIFEWQAVLAARLLAGRASLPPLAEQRQWEADRLAERGDGPKFALVFPDFEEYFETIRKLAGPSKNGSGRHLPPFQKEWFEAFMSGHERRKQMWQRNNKAFRGETTENQRPRL